MSPSSMNTQDNPGSSDTGTGTPGTTTDSGKGPHLAALRAGAGPVSPDLTPGGTGTQTDSGKGPHN